MRAKRMTLVTLLDIGNALFTGISVGSCWPEHVVCQDDELIALTAIR